MGFTLAHITAPNALAIFRDRLPSPAMFLASSLSTLCSLLTLLASVEAQGLNYSSSATKPPTSSVGSLPLSFQFSSPPTEPSSTFPGSSFTSPPSSLTSSRPPTASSGFSAIGNVLVPTITSYTFEPFPTPSESSIPKVFPETYPNNPPPVGDWAIPDFGPAWSAAYDKARAMVCGFLLSPPRFLSKTHAYCYLGSGLNAGRKSQYHDWRGLGERPVCRKHLASWRLPWSLLGSAFFRQVFWQTF